MPIICESGRIRIAIGEATGEFGVPRASAERRLAENNGWTVLQSGVLLVTCGRSTSSPILSAAEEHSRNFSADWISRAPAAVLHLRGPRAGGTLKRMAEPLKFEPFSLRADSDRVIRVRGTRVTLDTVWAAFQEGTTAEEIVQQYPSLSLADAYQAIGYSLRNPEALNAYLEKRNEATMPHPSPHRLFRPRQPQNGLKGQRRAIPGENSRKRCTASYVLDALTSSLARLLSSPQFSGSRKTDYPSAFRADFRSVAISVCRLIATTTRTLAQIAMRPTSGSAASFKREQWYYYTD